MVSFALDTPELAARYDVAGVRQYNHGRLLLDDLALAPGEQVLDVGCGTGLLTAEAAGRVGAAGRVVGLDPLPLRVALARERSRPWDGHTDFAVGRAEDLAGQEDGRFDAVYLNSVFHWLPEKHRPLAEALRVLRPGGRLGLTTATPDRPHDLARVIAELADEGVFPPATPWLGTPHRVRAEELRTLFTEAGFHVRQIEIRTFTDDFATVDELFAFSEASSFGNFFHTLPPATAQATRETVARRLTERFGTGTGLRLQRHLIFAVADKPL